MGFFLVHFTVKMGGNVDVGFFFVTDMYFFFLHNFL